jgi:prepilin-type N-terminal cleavage/methylation domain-containing protein
VITVSAIIAGVRRRQFGGEQGMTLVELVVAMAILAIALVIFLSTLTTIQKATVDEQHRSDTVDQVRLAMQSIDRQVRSGNLLYNPNTAYGTPPLPANYTLLIYTQSNLPTTGDKCVLWSINAANQLVTRAWPPLQPEDATQWQVVAEGVVNRVGATPTTAFSLDPTGRTITLTFLVNTDLAHSPNATQRLKSSVTGRNTSFGYPVNVCEDPPVPT